jgi:hypothetical protein
MEPAQQTLTNIPLLVFYPAALAFVAGAGYLGAMVGRSAPGKQQLAGTRMGAFAARASRHRGTRRGA